MRISSTLVATLALVLPSAAFAQNVVVGTPQSSIGDSFYESYGVGGSYSGRSVSFSWGGGGAVPPFGPYDPNNDARFGFQAGGLSLGFTAGQGSDRFSSSQTPMVTIPNGGTGSFFSGSQTPFVTSLVPVVGADGRVYGGGTSMLQDRMSRLQAGERPVPLKPEPAPVPQGGEAALRLGGARDRLNVLPTSSSSAEVAVASVEAQQAAYLAGQREESLAQRRELQEALDRAASAAERGKSALAKAYFDQALRNAVDQAQRDEVLRLRQNLSSDGR